MQNQAVNMFSEDLEKLIGEAIRHVVKDTVDQTQQQSSKRYYKKKEFCKEMGIVYNTLTVWINKGLPVIQVEGLTLIDMEDAIRFLNNHKK